MPETLVATAFHSIEQQQALQIYYNTGFPFLGSLARKTVLYSQPAGVKRRMSLRRSKGDHASTCYVDDNIYFYIIQPLACQVRGADFAIINCESKTDINQMNGSDIESSQPIYPGDDETDESPRPGCGLYISDYRKADIIK